MLWTIKLYRKQVSPKIDFVKHPVALDVNQFVHVSRIRKNLNIFVIEKYTAPELSLKIRYIFGDTWYTITQKKANQEGSDFYSMFTMSLCTLYLYTLLFAIALVSFQKERLGEAVMSQILNTSLTQVLFVV